MAPDQEQQEGRPCIVRELLSRLSDTGLEGHALAEEEDLVRNVAAVAFVGEHRQFSGASAGSSFLVALMHVAGADTVSWTHSRWYALTDRVYQDVVDTRIDLPRDEPLP